MGLILIKGVNNIMAMKYSEKVMDHFMNPRNVGEIENADAIGEVGNAKCGDILRIYLKISDDKIVDAKFKTFGCGSAIATSSIATEMIKGRPIKEAATLTNKAVVEALDGLPEIKVHCSVLAEQAVKSALLNYCKKNNLNIKETLGEDFKEFDEKECEDCKE